MTTYTEEGCPFTDMGSECPDPHHHHENSMTQDELEKDLRHYLSVALTPLFDIVKVAQKDRDNLFDAIVKGDLVLIDQHTKSEVNKVLDRLSAAEAKGLPLYAQFIAERKLYE